MAIDVRAQRERLLRAEQAALAHYGVTATSRPLELPGLGMTTRALRVEGAGPPVLLLHGTNMTASVFAPLLARLPGHELIAVDLPGCGLADPHTFDVDGLAAHQVAFVTAVLDEVAVEHAAVVGTSMGGWYGLRAAIRRPERIGRLVVLSAPAFALPGAVLPPMMALSATPLARRLAPRMPAPGPRMVKTALRGVGGRGCVRDVPRELFDALGAAMALGTANAGRMSATFARGRRAVPEVALTDDELRACEVPVLFVWGDEDRVQGTDAAYRAAELLPDARVEVLPGGHAVWFDAPERCGELIGRFLAAPADR
jgi:pimeloyl-ACP methyl ester carboxylesterase